MDHLEEILREIKDGKISTPDELQKAKIRMCREYNINDLPKNSVLLKRVEGLDDINRKDVISVLQRKPSRKKSGVIVIAVMTSPAECPHGKCTMCPGGPDTNNPSPQSYTGEEPAALRGKRNEYDPYKQIQDRVKQYKAIGHKTDKVDLIIMGGTFPARDWSYQKRFVKGCFDGLNGTTSDSLKDAQVINEKAKRRCIGLTIETRPDYCKKKELDQILTLGATRVEIGVQTLRNELLEKIQRGHTVEDSLEATYLAKERGLKVCYHMMPGLPGSSQEEDLNEFERLFKDDRFKPDMLKIYPTLVVKGTKLYNMWKRGEYNPLSTKKASELVAKMKSLVPKWVRIQRVQRDIPSPLVEAGVKKSNLRQYARRYLKEKKLECNCIRCREVGHVEKEIDTNNIKLNITKYRASKGTEYFLEYSDDDILVAYSRLRIGDKAGPTIRELKVVGAMTPINKKDIDFQHRGYGKRLVKESENIASEFHNIIRVTSGVGAREYYRKLGYELDNYYMVKSI